MTDRPPRGASPGKPIDTGTAHPARVHNCWLGGKDNFTADREAAQAAIAANPGIVASVRAGRAFLARTVRYLVAEAGVRQFLDIGTGLPTADNTHEVAQAIAPESRVVYVDNDPIVLAHARALLSSTSQGATAYLDADLREPDLILELAARTLDFSRPVALMLLMIVHFIPDGEYPGKIVERLLSALPAGSYLVLAHPASDVQPAVTAEMTRRLAERMRDSVVTLRSRDEVASFFGGLDLIEPGLVQPQQWRPDPTADMPAEVAAWCGVARKP
jgi:O-methyltransferase involved in polyketide biosynthesis